jgi:hypothetical protein
MGRLRASGKPLRRTACCLLAGLGCAVLLAAGCGPADGPAARGRRRPAAEAERSRLERLEADLDAHRARLAAGAPGTPEKVADPNLLRETAALSRDFDRRLAELLNADPPVQGAPLSPGQRAALRMKADQDVEIARTLIEHGGDTPRAIGIYQEDLALDPGNPRLRAELARAESRRYMTRAAFAQVQEGMDPEMVRRLLGAPNPDNVRGYPEKRVTGWFYPKDATGSAAAVWFHREEGRLAVYRADFDAVSPPQPAPPA